MFKKQYLYIICLFSVVPAHAVVQLTLKQQRCSAKNFWNGVVCHYLDRHKKAITSVMLSSDLWPDLKQNIKYNYLNHRGVPRIEQYNDLNFLLKTWRRKHRSEQRKHFESSGIPYEDEMCGCGCNTLQMKSLKEVEDEQ
jgi:hypothetical protein